MMKRIRKFLIAHAAVLHRAEHICTLAVGGAVFHGVHFIEVWASGALAAVVLIIVITGDEA